MTHPNGTRLKKDRGRCASRVANRLAESGAYPMSPALGATSGNFELDAIQRSGVSLDWRARLLEYDVPTQVFSWKLGLHRKKLGLCIGCGSEVRNEGEH